MLSDPANQQAALPNSTIASTCTPAFPATNNASYTFTLTCAATASITGTPANGNLLSLTLNENATGGWSFTFPSNFILPTVPPFTFNTSPLAINALTFKFDGTNWNLISNSSSSGTGTPCVITANSVQLNSSGNFGCSVVTDASGKFSVAENAGFLGPNPYTDATLHNIYSTATPGSAPWAPGITATISLSTPTTATVSSASIFQNGMGVTIPGAGPACTLGTPSGVVVTPSIAAAPTGTLIDVNAPAGSTSYAYEVIAVDRAECWTAASALASTSTGASSLGAQPLAITGFTQSGGTVTATVGSTAALTTGMYVYISATPNTDAPYFGGWHSITVASGTTFTFTTGNLVSSGAPAISAAGGTLYYWLTNHLTWSAVTNAYQYFIYGRNSGSLTLLGQTLPNNTAQGYTVTSWDDFGSTMMASQVFPFAIPTTPPSVSSPDSLTTTICAGGSTTTLTLCAPATTAVTNATILADNGPTLATLASASSGQLLYFPPGTYVVNSHTVLPGFPFIELACATLYLNGTVEIPSGERIYGMIGPQCLSSQQFGWPAGGTVQVAHTSPGIWDTNGNLPYVEGINFQDAGNASTAYLIDGGSQGHFKNINFIGTSTNGYMDIPLYMRGGFWHDFDHVSLNVGPGQAGGGYIGTTSTPGMSISSGDLTFNNMSVQARGIFLNFVGAPGVQVKFTGLSHVQGGITPFVTDYFTGGGIGGFISFDTVEMDTTQQNILANNGFSGAVNFPNVITYPPVGYGVVTGNAIALLVGTTSGQNSSAIAGSSFTNNFLNVYGTGEIGYQMSIPAAPLSCVTSSGGSVPTSAESYQLAAIDSNGNLTTIGPACTVTPTSGNQTVTITTPTTPTPGAVNYALYRNGTYLTNAGHTCNPISGSFSSAASGATYVDTAPSPCGQSQPTQNLAAASAISGVGVTTPSFGLVNGFTNFFVSSALTSNQTATLPNNTGTLAELNLAQSWPAVQTFASPVLNGSISGTGVQGTDTKVMSAGTVSGTGASLCTDASGGATTSGCPASASFYQTMLANATAQTQEPKLNFINGTNMTISCVDNAGSTRTDCTFTSSATGATAFSALTAATNSNSGTFAASGNVWDFSAATSLKVPVGAGAAPTASGLIAYNSTTNVWAFGQNGSTIGFGLSSSACSTNQWVSTPATSSATAACTQPAFSNLSGSATSGQLPTTIVYNNQTNTWSTGAQSFSAATSLTAPTSALYAPTTSAQFGYDSSNQKWVFGQNGSTISFGLSSSACGANSFVNTPATATAAASCAQPSFSNISGTVAASQLPTPTSSTLGGVESYAAVAHQWINAISTAGAPSSAAIGTNDVTPNLYGAGGGTAQAQTVVLSPAATSLVAGLQVFWLPTAANTGAAPTLAVNALTAKSITKFGNSTPLVANDLTTNAVAFAIYDGTEWQLQNPQTSTGGGSTITLQTLGANNITQTALNFVTSTANVIGITLTPSNPSGSQELFEATGRVVPAGGGTGLSSPAAHSLLVTEGSSNMNLVTSPTVNGSYVCLFNVTASAAVDPTCNLSGVPVDATNPATLLYSDRANYLRWTSGTTLTLPAASGNLAANLPFVLQNTSGSTLSLTPTTPNNIDGGSSQAASSLLSTFAAFVYQDATPNWWTIKVPTFASFGSTCANILSWSTTAGFSCVNTSGSMFANFSAHQFLGNNTASSAASSPSLIGTSDTSPNWYNVATGTAQAQVLTLTPAMTALTAGTIIEFLPVANNTGANPSLAVNSLTAKSITKFGGSTNLIAGDITTSAIAVVIYDGTQFELLNPQTVSGGSGTPCTTTANSLQYDNAGSFGCTNFTFASNTITAASASILDLSGATGSAAFKVPVQAGATSSANGVVDYDSTNQSTHIRTNGADSIAVAIASAPAGGKCAQTSGVTGLVVETSFGCVGAVASGTFTLGTTAISSGSCASVVTVSATGVATTDVLSVGFNSDPTAVTGYGASATGAVLTIYPYPTANNVNVKVCNSSSGSITPGAMTLNWKVSR